MVKRCLEGGRREVLKGGGGGSYGKRSVRSFVSGELERGEGKE